MHVVEK